MMVSMFTDGSCIGNPGPGGWGVVLEARGGKDRLELSGGKDTTTNNEMELAAVLEGLRALRLTGLQVAVYTDSQLVIGWLTGAYKVKQPHIARLVNDIKTVAEAKFLHIDWFHVKGHSGNPDNERANQLAQHEAARRKAALASPLPALPPALPDFADVAPF